MSKPASTPSLSAGVSDSVDERKFVVALARGLDLLRAFRPGETLLGNRDFVERTGLPKATVNRLAYTLTVLGYLRFDDALGKYALDAGVLSLGFALLSGTDTLELDQPEQLSSVNAVTVQSTGKFKKVATPPATSQNEVQNLIVTGTSGSFQVGFLGGTTAPLAFNVPPSGKFFNAGNEIACGE